MAIKNIFRFTRKSRAQKINAHILVEVEQTAASYADSETVLNDDDVHVRMIFDEHGNLVRAPSLSRTYQRIHPSR